MVHSPFAIRRPTVLRSPYLDSETALSLDRSGMLALAGGLAGELLAAWRTIRPPRFTAPAGGWQALVVAGMGGSATAGDYLAGLTGPAGKIPVIVNRSMDLPGFVSPRTPVICCSHSGNTTETVSCYRRARSLGAPIYAIRSGGELDRRAVEDGVDGTLIAGGQAPRAAFGLHLGAVLRVAEGLGVHPESGVERAVTAHQGLVRDRLGTDIPTGNNPAKALAQSIRGRIVIVVGAGHLTAAADRFKNQLAENGKSLATSIALPEAAHNTVSGLDTAGLSADHMALVTLESRRHYSPELAATFDAVLDEFAGEGVPVHRIRLTAETRLAELLEATAWADFVSCYVGLLNGVDPTPIARIARIKAAVGRELRTDG